MNPNVACDLQVHAQNKAEINNAEVLDHNVQTVSRSWKFCSLNYAYMSTARQTLARACQEPEESSERVSSEEMVRRMQSALKKRQANQLPSAQVGAGLAALQRV